MIVSHLCDTFVKLQSKLILWQEKKGIGGHDGEERMLEEVNEEKHEFNQSLTMVRT